MTTIRQRIAGIPPSAAAARLLRARAARARDRARRLDQCRDHRVPRRAQRRGRAQGGLAIVSIEQVLLWNPDVIVTIDRDFAANVHSDPAWASVAAVRAGRVHLSPKLPFGWVDFPPSVNRLIGLWWLAKILYPEQFPGGHPRADARFLPALLSRARRATRRSTACWRDGIDALDAGDDPTSLLASRASLIAARRAAGRAGCCVAFTVGRYPVGLGDLFDVLVVEARPAARRACRPRSRT